MLASDAAAIAVVAVVSLFVTLAPGLSSPSEASFVVGIALLATLPVMWGMGLHRSVIRFMGLDLFVNAFRIAALSAVILTLVSLVMPTREIPLRTILVYWAGVLIWISGSRMMSRLLLRGSTRRGDRVIVYGAGESGVRLTSSLSGSAEHVPVCFVDDNEGLWGSVLNGLEVHSPRALPEMVAELGVSRVLLALPSASRRRRRDILLTLENLPVHVQTIPDISDLVTGRARVDSIKEVDVEDLLGRDPVPPVPGLLDACVRNKSVLVTGAGGSIGSELCRQIARLKPTRLVLLELSEIALYSIEKDLRQLRETESLEIELIPLLGSAHHKSRVRSILSSYSVNTVYHAAAYKHVPIVEHNVLEGVHNNVFGTLHTAEAAVEAGVETFVLISTDKAVNPTNTMGATKRFAELVLQALQDRSESTTFCMVRFGNVLASSGSVVPLFREQIRQGGPVTVTHPEIIRYFMTIPEAAQLVIQAGSMGQGGDVFVLDMGKPVLIRDLAYRMINLMGFTVRDDENADGDIEIQYTGLRPAEKLYEELLIGNDVVGTHHQRIMRAAEEFLPWGELKQRIQGLWEASQRGDCETARQILLNTINEYQPTNGIEDLVWQCGQSE
ncbi:MAG: nucleoside-diphosphate sugar epimerase/dehydratase, partial [Planctomycetota bacterium]